MKCKNCSNSCPERPFGRKRIFCSDTCCTKYHNRGDRIKDRTLKHRYGISLEKYEEMRAEQSHRCAACGRIPEKIGETADIATLTVDHDHSCCPGPRSCGRCVRALLCNRCNMAAGAVSDNFAQLRLLADWLETVTSSDTVIQQLSARSPG